MKNIFSYLDQTADTPKGKLLNQLVPVATCLVLLSVFIAASWVFITYLINPHSIEHIKLNFRLIDVLVGFFLYFATAIDYALIVGRMQSNNPGSKARFIMNIFTCVGCFVGVSLVLFLWGYARNFPALIIPVLFFAGSVMVKLAYEGIGYFEHATVIPKIIRQFTVKFLHILYYPTRFITFWIPELGSPKVAQMDYGNLAKWAFFLPFIIGLDDLVGYMGAMTIYNVFGLLIGIYLADIIIDILIFLSPKFTTELVESPILSIIAAFAFIYLGWKSFSEAAISLNEHFSVRYTSELLAIAGIILITLFVDFVILKRKKNLFR